MFRLKNVSTIVIAVGILLGLISCNNDLDGEGDIQIIGDVFILKRIIDEKIQYGPTYYLYANYPITSASVTPPNEETIPLSVSDQLSVVFSKEPGFDDYSENIPQNGTFNFNAKHLDLELHATDNLDFIDIAIPVITSTEYLSSVETLKVEWNTVPDADSYIIRMINVDNNIFFTGLLLDEDATSYEINVNTGTWLDHPAYNDRLVVELHASRYKQNTGKLETYHLEEVSIAEETIFWGVKN